MQDMMDRQETARELAFLIDEDGITDEELDETMREMREQVEAGAGRPMADNLQILEDARREMDCWSEAAEQGASVPPAPAPAPYARVYVIDDNRHGVAREQIVEILSAGALSVVEQDLKAAGFSRVISIRDGSVTAGTSIIYYLPSTEAYISKGAWAQDINMIFDALTRKGMK